MHPCILLKQRAKSSTHQTSRLRLVVRFVSNVVVGDFQEAWQMLHEAAPLRRPSPRTVLTENICRCVQQILQHWPVAMPFLTTSTITLSCLASAAPQADSLWLGHLVPDVVFADTGGHALDIFLHGPESAHKNGIVKTNIRSPSIPIRPCTLLKNKQRPKSSIHETWRLRLLVLFLSNVVVGYDQELCRCSSGLVYVEGLLA